MNPIKAISNCSLLLAIACGGKPIASSPSPDLDAPEPFAPAPVAVMPAAPAPIASAAPPAAAPGPKLVFELKEGLSTPESVLYDVSQDRYLISNINGAPTDVDDNGFIAEVTPDGKVTNAQFVAGGINKVKLDAPKGMGISKGILYVADIASVRKFDAKTGAPKGEIAIAGATFLNDIAVSADGKIYVSDSGLKAGANGLDPSGTDAVYVIEGNKARPIAKSKELKSPNGLAFMGKELVVVTFGGDEAYKLSDKGERTDLTRIPAGTLDGIIALESELLISSWASSAIYRGKLGAEFVVAIPEVPAPADIGFDTKRKRVLVPLFKDNVVKVFESP